MWFKSFKGKEIMLRDFVELTQPKNFPEVICTKPELLKL